MPEWAELQRKTGQGGLLITRYKSEKTDRAVTPASEGVPARSALPGSLEAKQLHRLHTQPSLGQSCHGQKRPASVRAGSPRPCPPLCDPVDCGLPGFSAREGVLQARILERIGQCWLPCPSGALYFLLPWPPAPLSTWCCQNTCGPNSCTTAPRGPQRANPSPPGQPQEQTPVDDPHAEVEVIPQLKPRGSMAKEEDPKPFHQLYSYRLNPHDQLGRLSMEYVKDHRELPPIH